MKRMRFITFAIFVVVSISCAYAADDRPAARAKYAELAAKLRAGDSAIDWQALRVAAAVGEVGDTPEDFQAIQRGHEALNQGKFQDALKESRAIEEHNIADGDAH